MVDIFGVVPGAAGLLSFIGQLHTGIHALQKVRKHAKEAQEQFDFLEGEVERLKFLIHQVHINASSSNDGVLQKLIPQCQSSCNEVVQGLKKLEQSLSKRLKSTLQKKVPKALAFKIWKDDLEALEGKIKRAKEDLMTTVTYNTSIQVAALVSKPSLPAPPISSPSECSSSTPTSGESLRPPRLLKPPRCWDCEKRHCSCSCHSITNTNGRFWALEHTALSVFTKTCSNEFCSVTRYRVGFRIALSQFGIGQSVTIQLSLVVGGGSFSPSQGLTLERIVPYTSPGFEILWKVEKGYMTFEKARKGLIALRKSDGTFKDHVDPSGRSYIEQLAHRSWGYGVRDAQYELLRLFMSEFEMTRGTNKLSCAEWIGEGPHLDWLQHLLDLKYDATVVDSPTAQDWPQPCSPNWIAEDIAPDPFFIEYLGLLCRDNQGFGMMSPLHEAVLSCSTDVVERWITRSQKDERNFLGQTPLHLAVLKPHHLASLVRSGHKVDAVDNYGITALMYAAAMNQEESLMKLLEAGARPDIKDTRFGRTFLHYAAIRNHWNLMIPVLDKIGTLVG
ncbi:hypothetical protein EDB80DRAFT_890962 [Ilyonectria destructans]|nr:hypothetical protein EDB80DRAFT_890962 [Ilyonectria destructans]